jgi:IS4 transposase
MPKTSSTDYRLCLYKFVLSTLIYNLWRLTDNLIKVALNEPILVTASDHGEDIRSSVGRLALSVSHISA